MTVSSEQLAWILDQLRDLGPVSVRGLAGGAGLVLDGTVFGRVEADGVYFRVGDANRLDYVERGMGPLEASAHDASPAWFEVPADVLEDRSELAQWARKALEAPEPPAMPRRARPRRTASRGRRSARAARA